MLKNHDLMPFKTFVLKEDSKAEKVDITDLSLIFSDDTFHIFDMLKSGESWISDDWETTVTRLPDTPSEKAERFVKALFDAKQAWWGSIIRSYPEILTGDLPPEEVKTFDTTAMEYLRCWLEYNKPFKK